MVRTTLKILSVLLVVMGIVGLIPSWTWAVVPAWYAIVKIVLGVIGFGIGYASKN